MSLHLAAKHLSSKGRGPDSVLVHMAPNEVTGLQALAKAHGGSLSLNPDTGLPEAGFLSSILPAIAGFALGPAGFGLMSPMMAGATVGGISALSSGNLGKGLMAGMGAYGGAGLGAGLMGMGESAAIDQALAANKGLSGMDYMQATDNAAAQMANASPTSGWDKAVAGAKAGWNDPSKLVSGIGGGNFKKGAGYIAAAATPTVMQVLAPEQSTAIGPRGDSVKAQKLQYNTSTGRYDPVYAEGGVTRWNTTWKPDVPDYGQQNQDFSKEILYYDMLSNNKPEELKKPIAADVNKEAPSGFSPGDGVQDQGGISSLNGTINSLAGLMPDFTDSRVSSSIADLDAPSYANPGAMTGYSAADAPGYGWGGFDTAGMDIGGGNIGVDTNAGEGGVGGVSGAGGVGNGGGNADPASLGLAAGGMSGYAAGGLGSLGSYSDGGRLLRGPGDGVSDSIPATIGHQKQPARLADGEFVIPARIVSELGNGSTEAGSRKLYAMMDRIQKNRKKSVGKNKVAVNSKSDRYLPA
jgi:hypothetical protein